MTWEKLCDILARQINFLVFFIIFTNFGKLVSLKMVRLAIDFSHCFREISFAQILAKTAKSAKNGVLLCVFVYIANDANILQKTISKSALPPCFSCFSGKCLKISKNMRNPK